MYKTIQLIHKPIIYVQDDTAPISSPGPGYILCRFKINEKAKEHVLN